MKIALLGTGLIGGSVGMAIRSRVAGAGVVAYDRDPLTAEKAVEQGAADRFASSVEDAVQGADLVFIATPVSAIPGIAKLAIPYLREGAILTDVGSTKSQVVLEIEPAMPSGRTFIGGHPMAGSEDEGIAAARANLFDGAWWILTPSLHANPEAYERLQSVLTMLGARVTTLQPTEHDELMAVISHLPQLVATTLMNLAAEAGQEHASLLALAAGGFRDVTRLAASNPDIWVDICKQNGTAIASTLRNFAKSLVNMAELIEKGDAEAIRGALGSARDARRSLPGKIVPEEPFEVCFPVPDRPGVLAEVTTSIGNLGINIEDLRIVHTTEGARGIVHLLISGRAHADRAAAALSENGFDTKVIQL